MHTQHFSPLTKQQASHQTPASTIAGDASQFHQQERTSTADNETQSQEKTDVGGVKQKAKTKVLFELGWMKSVEVKM